MQEVPLTPLLCESGAMARIIKFFLYALFFQLVLFLSLDYTLCPPQHVTSTQVRPLPCTEDTYAADDHAQVDSTHPPLDEAAQAAPLVDSTDEEEQEEEEEEEEVPRSVLTIVY